MNTSYLFKLFNVLFIILSFIGCHEEVEYTPWLKGDIRGMINTFDQFGTVYADHSGVAVSTQGIDGNYLTRTNKDGIFVLEDVPNGTYDLQFEKEGFGILKYQGVKHLGGKPTIIPGEENVAQGQIFFYLYEVPTSIINNIVITSDSISADITMDGSFRPDRIFLKVYFSASPAFETRDAVIDIDYDLPFYNGMYSDVTLGNFRTDGKYYQDYFSQGDTIYFRASLFTLVYRGVDKYYDFELKKWIYPNLGNESVTWSFVLEE